MGKKGVVIMHFVFLTELSSSFRHAGAMTEQSPDRRQTDTQPMFYTCSVHLQNFHREHKYLLVFSHQLG